MMKTTSTLIIAIMGTLLAVWVSGCATLKQYVKQPRVTYQSMSLREMSLFDSTVVFHLTVSNPYPISIKINEFTYRIKVNNKDLLSGVLDKGISLKANGDEPLEIPVTIKYMDFFNSLSDFMSRDEVAWDLSGSARILGLDIPYHANGNLPVPKLPKISLKRIDISKIDLFGASLVFLLDVKNDNPFALNLSRLDYNIKIGSTPFVKGKTKNTPSIGDNKNATISIPVHVSFMELGKSAYNLLKKSASDYELSGNLTVNVPSVGEKSFPFSKKGSVPFIK